MKKNITILALNKQFKKKIAKNLSKKLDMFYVDTNELLKYDLMNIDKVIKLAGLDYYNKVEEKTIKSLSSYENVIITMDNDSFFNKNNYKYLKESSLFIYIKLSYKLFVQILTKEKPKTSKYELMLDKKVYNERDKILTEVCDIKVNITESTKNIEDKIIEEIKKYYKDIL